MKSAISGALVAVMMSTAGAGYALAADITPQTVVKVDMSHLENAYRASKIIGAAVVNENNDNVGTIDDLLINRSDNVPYAVLSVGGFLGVGTKYVALPYKSLKITDNKVVFPGGSKDAVKAMPEFKYATK